MFKRLFALLVLLAAPAVGQDPCPCPEAAPEPAPPPPTWTGSIGLSYLVTRDNLPAPGFEKTDTTTSVSVVWTR